MKWLIVYLSLLGGGLFCLCNWCNWRTLEFEVNLKSIYSVWDNWAVPDTW